MTAFTLALLVLLATVVMLYALRRGGRVTARCKLPGVDLSIDAHDKCTNRLKKTTRMKGELADAIHRSAPAVAPKDKSGQGGGR
jgi:hypothetical protein